MKPLVPHGLAGWGVACIALAYPITAQAELLETIILPVDGSIMTSSTSLEAGTEYYVRAAGSAILNGFGDRGDAEWQDFGRYPRDTACRGDDLVDLGITIDGVNPKWGPFAPDHVYAIPYTGTGGPIQFSYLICRYEGESGSITVDIMDTPPDPLAVWDHDGDGDWNVASNWAPASVPDGDDRRALFGTAVSGPTTVTADSDVSVQTIQFGRASDASTTPNYTMAGSGSVTLAAATGDHTGMILGNGGEHQFLTTVNLTEDLDLEFHGGGVLTFDGPLNLNGNTLNQYSGSIVINGTPDGAMGGHLVMSGPASLAGAGEIEGDVTVAGWGTKRIRPGRGPATRNGPGILTVQGNYVQGTNARLTMEIGGPTSGNDYDVLRILGDASLAGRLWLYGNDQYSPTAEGQEFTIVEIGGSRAGTLSSDYQELANDDWVRNFGPDYALYIRYDGGDGNDVVLYTQTGPTRGDLDLDGDVDFDDADDFYDAQFGGPSSIEQRQVADIDGSGDIDEEDEALFFERLGATEENPGSPWGRIGPSDAPELEVWLSAVGQVGGGVQLGNANVSTGVGGKGQQMHIWMRPTVSTKNQNGIDLNIKSTNEEVIDFTGVTIHNPLLLDHPSFGDAYRWEYVGQPAPDLDPDHIEGLSGFSGTGRAGGGLGIGSYILQFADENGTLAETDPFYDPDANAWLLATITYDITGEGSTDLFLQIGDSGVLGNGEPADENGTLNASSSADIGVIFGGGSGPGDGSLPDPGLNADTERGINSLTADGSVTAILTLGDMDCDGDLDFDDIDDLVFALNDAAGYEAHFGVPPELKGDIDGDGDNDFDDIDDFVGLLNALRNAGEAHGIPEPSALCLAALAMLCLAGSRRQAASQAVRGGCHPGGTLTAHPA